MSETTLSNTDAWLPYEPTDAAPWNVRRVVHLHRRAGFAGDWTEIERDLADGPGPAIERVLATGEPPVATFETMARTIGDAAQGTGSPDRLKAWWVYRMLLAPDPLAER